MFLFSSFSRMPGLKLGSKKVNLSLGFINYHARKTYGGVEV
jgi:hypothetical protein